MSKWVEIPVLYRVAIIGCFILMVGIIGLGGLAHHHATLAAEHAQEAAQAIANRDTAIAQARASEAKAQTQEGAAVEAIHTADLFKNQNAILQKKLTSLPIPQKPEDPPTEDTVLAAQLKEGGMIQPPAARQDAVLVWNWRQAAATVPLWEARYNACQDLNVGYAGELQAKGKAIDELQGTVTTLKVAVTQWKQASDDGQVATAQLKAQIGEMTKAATASRYQKYLLVGGALAGGYFLGRHK